MSLTNRGIAVLSKYIIRVPQVTPQVCTYKRWVAPTLRALESTRRKLPEQKPSPRSSHLEWNYDAELFAFCKRLNEEFDKTLLKQALSHQSYIFKLQQEPGNEDKTLEDNSVMIEVGDKILQKYIQQRFNYPKVIMDSIEKYLMNEEKLAYVAKHIGLKDLILTEEYPPTSTTLANTLKALLSALEQSSGPLKTQKFIDDFIITQLHDVDILDVWEPSEPFKYLTESLLDGKPVEPRLCNQSASSTILANYQVGLYTDDRQLLGIGWGESIDIAKNTAALDAIRKIYQI